MFVTWSKPGRAGLNQRWFNHKGHKDHEVSLYFYEDIKNKYIIFPLCASWLNGYLGQF
jgi:hypothetical protein